MQVPFIIALSVGKNDTNDGITSGLGTTLRLKIKTTTNTNMDTAATNRNINLSVMLLKIQESGIKSQELSSLFISYLFN